MCLHYTRNYNTFHKIRKDEIQFSITYIFGLLVSKGQIVIYNSFNRQLGTRFTVNKKSPMITLLKETAFTRVGVRGVESSSYKSMHFAIVCDCMNNERS